ncbi:DUF3494 domain-containing protein [Corallococcus carmarthensis]|uniref:DUF3494 domain-containing protein n=1 Tax=Corallococcus carmarthensis TaxID=2316728 RepID=A0A3A8L0A4_9BACT|nr:DUF3494 domain-containing protein [Corallococcus carmarthensis]RKH07674.1 DUF3494 domain-containing protein [Corallococcus carmarthensis]
MIQTQAAGGLFSRLASLVLSLALLSACGSVREASEGEEMGVSQAAIAVAPSLGTAQSFAVLGASTVTNTGPTVIAGDLGVSPGTAITGFPPGLVVGGVIHAADAVAAQAQSDTTAAYNNLAGQPCDFTLPSAELGGLTLVPGVYCFSSASAQLTGALALNAQGNPNAVWVFKIASTLITASNSSVLLINGAQACNVFWQVGSSATIGTGSDFVGNILALTSITLTTDATVAGRALARNGAVTLDSNEVTISACAGPVTPLPPTVGKAFSPATINAGGISTLTITLSNPDPTVATLTSPLVDTLPAGVTVAGPATTTCGGTATTTASTVTQTGGAIPANGSCTVTVPVTATAGGNYINSLAIGALQTGNGSNVAPAAATLTVAQPAIAPTVGKAFSPATINAGGTSTLTITLSNASATPAVLTSPLVDTLPAGVTVSGAATTTCGGAVTTTASTVTLTGGSIPANGSCTVTVPVTAAAGGNYINSIAAGALQTGNGSNAAPAIATLTVNAPAGGAPTLGKAFSPPTINAGGISILTITLSNTSATPAVLTAPLVDTLPAGVTVSGTASTTCGGAVTTSASTVTLTGGTIPANGSCTVTVPVTAPSGGSFINALPAGALQTGNGNNAAPAIATLTVNAPAGGAPTLGKAFSPATINAGGISILTITLSNTSATPAVLTAPLVDTLPAGVTVAGAASTTCGGAVTTTASTVTLTGGTIPANGSCTVTVPVTAPAGGSFINALPAGALQTGNGNNAAPAIATLTVNAPAGGAPTLGKAFSPSTINPGGISTLTITLSNTSATPAVLTAPLVDTLPAGVTVAGAASTTCGGAVTTTASTVTLMGGTIPANGSCTVTVPVTAPAGGNYINSLAAGALQTGNGNNAAPAIATLTVTIPSAVTLGKAFSPATIKAGGTSTLTITLINFNNAMPAILTAPLVDTLPAGVTVSGAGSTTCGGLVTTTATTVTLTGGAIPANGSCTVTVPVTAPVAGSFINALLAGALQTNRGNNAAPAVATLTVVPMQGGGDKAPTVKKYFNPSTIGTGGISTLTLTLTNPNATPAVLTAPLKDVLPDGLLVYGNADNTCGGVATATPGSSLVVLTGGAIPANGSCTVTVDVTAKKEGSYCNVIPKGALQTNKGSNMAPAEATLTVKNGMKVAPRLAKSFSPSTIKEGKTSLLTITLINPNGKPASLTSSLDDVFPDGMVAAGNATTTCGGSLMAYWGSSKVVMWGGSIPANGSCTVKVAVTTDCKGQFRNKLHVGALETNLGSNTAPAEATLTVN